MLTSRSSQKADMLPLDDVPETEAELSRSCCELPTTAKLKHLPPSTRRVFAARIVPARQSGNSRSGDSELAVQCYRLAYESGERLDSRKDQEIREDLAQHRVKAKKIQLPASARDKFMKAISASRANDEFLRRLYRQIR